MLENERKKCILDIPDNQLTPGMRQYKEAKQSHPDSIIMLRMGDFYELFYDDAVTAAKELEITLTKRGKGEKSAPLAGVPYHALEGYLAKLVNIGYKVAIVEQLEDPKKAKGLVKRGVVRVVTPGTVIESSMLEEKENNYLMALTSFGEEYALALCDLSTGEFFTSLISSFNNLINELVRFNPRECIVPESLLINEELVVNLKKQNCFVNSIEDYYFKFDKAKSTLLNHFNINTLDSFGIGDKKLNISVSGALLHYLIDTQKNSLSHLKKLSLRNNQNKMILDSSTLRNLELLKNIRDNSPKGTLLSVLDKTVTSMGSRLLKKWIKQPLLKIERINARLFAIKELNQEIINREELIGLLKSVYDLERLISRVNYGNASPRDLISLKISLQTLPVIQHKMEKLQFPLLQNIRSLPRMDDLTAVLHAGLMEDAPIIIRDGGIIKDNYNEELDQLRDIKFNGKKYLQELGLREKEKTGISTLKIGFNRVFGYFIEITKKNLHLVPENYIRKQTTANAERYITEELKIEEEKILGAEEKIKELEFRLFQDLLKIVSSKTKDIQEAAIKLAVLDVLCSLARIAMENNYSLPGLVEDKVLRIKNGRHPVVERLEDRFIANDVILENGEMMIITGPNMAGKSTVMRQTALIVLMAQIGSYVPAESVEMGIVDRIFTRVGAHDDLSSGQSTFMVEMNETASIINNATENSLIIMDEIGRGTSTFDGVSIAWSVAEHLYNKVKAKTLFATHYHVMNKLSEKFSKINNYNIAVQENSGEVTFLYKLIEGGTDQSYGVHVAKLAGLPNDVIYRAKEIQTILEKDDDMVRKIKAKKLQEQMSLDGFGLGKL